MYCFVSSALEAGVAVINVTSNTGVTAFALTGTDIPIPQGSVYVNSNDSIYLCDKGNNTLIKVDCSSNTVSNTIQVVTGALLNQEMFVTYDIANDKVLVTNGKSITAYVLNFRKNIKKYCVFYHIANDIFDSIFGYKRILSNYTILSPSN